MEPFSVQLATFHDCFISCSTSNSIRRGALRSLITRLLCGVLQGPVLGPLLFILYTFDLVQLIEGHGLGPHLYADDTRVSGSCHPSNVSAFSSSISDCLRDVASLMKSNRLQLKTEVMWCATSQHFLPASALSVDGVMDDPMTSVLDLGLYIDADLSMRTHVQPTVT